MRFVPIRFRARPLARLALVSLLAQTWVPWSAVAADPPSALPAEPDPRWSMIHVLERSDPAEAPEPVVQHSPTVPSRTLPPQDSPDVAVLPSGVVTQSENSVAVHPTNPDIVLVSNNATDWPVTQVFGTGVYWSFDGGVTWTGDDQGPGGVGNRGDPAAVISLLDGRWAVGYISNSGGMGASYTTNQGVTWSHRTISSAGGLDKNHLEVDNVPTSAHFGNLYSSWVNLGGGSNVNDIEISRSTDGGDTWSAVQNISDALNAGSHNQGVNIRIGPNGEVYAAWSVYDCWPCEEIAIGLNKSTDGGVSWVGETRAITNIRGHRQTSLPNTTIRRNSFPAMAVDVSGGPNDGAVYVVWTNQGVPGVNVGDVDIWCAKSTDGGATFGTAVRVNQDAGTNSQWFPWIACDPVTGQLTAIFLDRRDDPSNTQARAYMAISNDGGATWEDFAVGDVSFTPVPIPGLAGGYMGDYIGIAVASGRAYPTWSDNRAGNFLCYVSPILVSDPTDPNPPTGVSATSDYTTPTSVTLDWTDPTTYADGSPLGDFSIDISRDGGLPVNVDQGIETYLDSGLTDGQQYTYTLQARDDVTDSLSIEVNVTAYAGGSPFPAAPSNIACSADTVSATITWTNPTTQSDGTPLDDFAGVRVYRDATLVIEMARAPGDTGTADSYVDSPPPGFVYSYAVAAIDSEAPVNESAWAVADECFVGSVPSILVWKPADTGTISGTEMFTVLSDLGESVILTDNLFEFAPDLNAHEIVMVAVGIYSDNHIIDAIEGAALDDFVQDGGRLYLEGGDCFNYDPESAGGYNIRPIFGLADGPDGSADLFGVTGLNDLAGFDLAYAGVNAWIDELQPTTSTPIWQNDSNSDLVGVFHPGYGSGRSIGASFEFGGLVDVPSRARIVAAHDVSGRVFPTGPPDEPIVSGRNFAKERQRESVEPREFHKRAANTESRPAVAPVRVDGGMGSAVRALQAANTKEDVMAAYLTLLRATGDPVMVVSTTSLESTIFQDTQDTQFFDVSNPGTLNDDLQFTVTESPEVGWLSVSPAADTLGANGSSIITVDFDATGLLPGPYTTDLIVAGNDPVNPTDTVAVTLNVLGVPVISVTPDSLFFAVPPFVSADDSVTISNGGLGDLDYNLFLAGSSGSDRLEFGGTASSGSGIGRFRGNVYQVDVGIPLKAIEHFLSIPTPTQLEFFVFESSTATGTYTKIHSTTITSGTGQAWYGSGSIDVPLDAGKFYFIGTGWMGSATYYWDASISLPSPIPFGSVLYPGGTNSYPPPATWFIPGTGAIVHSQALEYGVPADVEILSPVSGTVPPAGSTVVNVRATGGPDPGTFFAELHVSSNDPFQGDVVVPITIEVGTATASPIVEAPRPTVLQLHQSTPNPFRGGVTIRFDLPRPGPVSLHVFDVAGRLVATLVDGPVEAGYRSARWNGQDSLGRRVASGVYFYALTAEDRVIRRKMIHLR